MGLVVTVIRGDAGEEVLIALAGQQIAVIQRGAAEIREQRVARAVHFHLEAARHLHSVI